MTYNPLYDIGNQEPSAVYSKLVLYDNTYDPSGSLYTGDGNSRIFLDLTSSNALLSQKAINSTNAISSLSASLAVSGTVNTTATYKFIFY